MASSRQHLGRRAEALVCDYLFAHGFTILANNLRLGRLELDVVARRGALVVIVEVRTRGAGAFESALASVTAKKRACLLRAADALWRTRIVAMKDVTRLRIDVAAVTFDGVGARVDYVEGAIVAA